MNRSKLITYIIDNNLEKESYTGKVLWWKDRDGFGIIQLANGSEIYADISVVQNRQNLKPGQEVKFNFNINIRDCACAKNVEVV